VNPPTDDLPSVDTETCDLPRCREPWAIETRADNGPRMLRICEQHAARWLEAEQLRRAS
jgi:hypothetical protein